MYISNPKAQLNILTIADLDWRNGIEYSFQGLKILKSYGISFSYRLIGDGPFIEAVSYCRHELGLEAESEIILKCSPGYKEDLFNWANIFLLTAVAPNAKNDLAGAIKSNLPIVCTDVDSTIMKSVNIHFIPKRDPLSIAQILNSTYKDRFPTSKLYD